MPPLSYPHLCEQPRIRSLYVISAELNASEISPTRICNFWQTFIWEAHCKNLINLTRLQQPIDTSFLISSEASFRLQTDISILLELSTSPILLIPQPLSLLPQGLINRECFPNDIIELRSKFHQFCESYLRR